MILKKAFRDSITKFAWIDLFLNILNNFSVFEYPRLYAKLSIKSEANRLVSRDEK